MHVSNKRIYRPLKHSSTHNLFISENYCVSKIEADCEVQGRSRLILLIQSKLFKQLISYGPIQYGPYDIRNVAWTRSEKNRKKKLKIDLVKYLLNFVFSAESVFDICCHRNGFFICHYSWRLIHFDLELLSASNSLCRA